MESISPKADPPKSSHPSKPNLPIKPSVPSATRASTVGESAQGEHKMDLEKIAAGVRLILEGVGEDPTRAELLETPARVARMYKELLYGTDVDAGAEITCTFNEENDELVLVKDISFSSICEHHMVPFIGVAHVGYIPNQGKITGLSKLARVVELASRKLQVQERMTAQIADAIMRRLDPLGVIVVLEAEHFCMSIRGVRKPGSKTVTTAARGILQEDKSARAEVMAFIHSRQG
jgi:GTP cyclohydrolase IA